MASVFWFNVHDSAIDLGYSPEMVFLAWVTGDYGQNSLFPVLHSPQEPPFESTAEYPL
jgi:hypothetical protein